MNLSPSLEEHMRNYIRSQNELQLKIEECPRMKDTNKGTSCAQISYLILHFLKKYKSILKFHLTSQPICEHYSPNRELKLCKEHHELHKNVALFYFYMGFEEALKIGEINAYRFVETIIGHPKTKNDIEIIISKLDELCPALIVNKQVEDFLQCDFCGENLASLIFDSESGVEFVVTTNSIAKFVYNYCHLLNKLLLVLKLQPERYEHFNREKQWKSAFIELVNKFNKFMKTTISKTNTKKISIFKVFGMIHAQYDKPKTMDSIHTLLDNIYREDRATKAMVRYYIHRDFEPSSQNLDELIENYNKYNCTHPSDEFTHE